MARRLLPLLFLLPAAMVPALWWPTLGHSFQFDDWNVIVDNPAVRGVAAWWYAQPGIRPLLKLSYALNGAAGGGPEGFRAVNILVHAANAALVALLARSRLCRWGVPGGQAVPWAAAAALLFALHPVQTEAVTYISGRSASLAALFALASLYAWDRAIRPGAAWVWFGLAGLLAILAVAVKETAVVLPLVFWLWSAGGDTRVPVRPMLVAAAMFALGVAALLASYASLLRFSMDIRPLGETLARQAVAVPYLLSHLAWLDRIDIDPQVPDTAGWRLAAATFWLAAAALLLARYPGRQVARFVLLWVLLWLAPTNSVVPRLDLVNDRHLYLPMASLAWGAAWVFWRIGRHGRPAAVLAVLAAVGVAGVLAAATASRNQDYASEVSLWRRTAAQNPLSARAANNLGFALASRCDWAGATAQFRRALTLDPAWIEASANLWLVETGRFGERYPLDCRAP